LLLSRLLLSLQPKDFYRALALFCKTPSHDAPGGPLHSPVGDDVEPPSVVAEADLTEVDLLKRSPAMMWLAVPLAGRLPLRAGKEPPTYSGLIVAWDPADTIPSVPRDVPCGSG